jgi:TRAP-type C4-dicarboxylate transport system substrate-binding protein
MYLIPFIRNGVKEADAIYDGVRLVRNWQPMEPKGIKLLAYIQNDSASLPTVYGKLKKPEVLKGL